MLHNRASKIVFLTGIFTRRILCATAYFMTRYIYSLLDGKDVGNITFEIKAERLKGETVTIDTEDVTKAMSDKGGGGIIISDSGMTQEDIDRYNSGADWYEIPQSPDVVW